MPISLRELYARKASNDAETQSRINRALYEQEYASGIITGSAVNSGAARNFYLGLTPTPQDIIYDTTPPPPVISAKELTTDTEDLLSLSHTASLSGGQMTTGDIKTLSKSYEDIFKKLDDGTATLDDYNNLTNWVNSMENPVPGFMNVVASIRSIWNKSASEKTFNLDTQFKNKKEALLKKIAQKGTWLQGKEIGAQEAFLDASKGLPASLDPLVQLKEFNRKFKPEEFNTSVDFYTKAEKGVNFPSVNPIATGFYNDFYNQKIARAGLKSLTPGTDLYKALGGEQAEAMLTASGNELAQVFAGGAVTTGGFPKENLEKVYKAQKELLGDALTKKSAYYIKLLEDAQKTGNTELFNESKAAIEKIQAWHNLNNPKKNTVVESGFLPTVSRAYEEFKTAATGAFKSTARFLGKPLYSVFGSDQMVAKEKEAIMNLKVAPISVPMDINSDGKINTLDYDYYGNPVFSSTFHYQGKDGEWKTNWAAIPEISARVIGQMAPTLFLGGLAGRIGASLTEGVVGAEAAAAGLTTARNLNFAQKAAVKAKAINEFAGLRLLDRIGTYATVTASTYDMMLDDELRYTKDINKAKARALGRASIEGFTEMIGVPEFGILKPGRYGISMANAVREVGLSSLPKKLTKTQLVGRVLGGVGTAGKRVLGQSISESFEEVAADMGNYMMTSYIKGHDPSYIKEDELTGQSLINTFTESFFSMLPFTGVTTSIQSINEYNSGQRLSAAQWAIANNPDVALSYIKSQQEKGKVTKDEALRMTNEVVKLKNTLASMEDINKVKDLRTLLDDPEAQRKYFNLVMHRNNLLEVDYDSLGEEEKKIINKHKVDMQLTEKAQSALTALKEKQKALTPEEVSELAQLKSKKEKTEEEQKREQTLSGRGELKGIDKIQFDYLNSLTRMTSFDRSKLSAEDYKKLVDAKIITQEDLTPKKEDLEKQLKDVDSKLYKYKELTDKYDSLTKEDKNKIVTDLFNQEIESTSQSTSPQELAELVKATTNQLNIIKTFNNLSPLDYDLRASLLEAATNRFEELVTKDENGVNGLTRTLLEEDTSQLGPTALQQKAAFVDQQTRQGYVDETSAQELMRKYLDPVYQNIQKFNESTQEEKIDALVNYFEQSNIEERFNLEDTLADWTVVAGGEEVQANIDEATFEAAQDKYYQLRGKNRAAGNVDASVSTGDISTPETGAGEVVETTPGAEVPGEYSTEGEVSTSTQDTIEKTEDPSVDKFDKYAKDILTEMGKKNYSQTATQVAISLAATFSKRINEAISRGETVRAPASVHNTVVGIMKDVVTGKKTYDKAVEELQGLLNAQLPRTVAKNLTYRDKANFYLKVANVLTNYVEAEKGLSRQELESELGRTDVKIYPIDTSGNATAEVHDSVDLQKKEAELKAQEAQVMSWINPLRTAAFETNEDVVSDDPARVRNAEILNFVQENPNPERKIQVSSREYFYKQILKDKYEDFKARLKKAVEENDTSEATLTELQAFFGGDFFAVKPTATGKAELIYLIQEKGFGVLEGQSSIVTFVVNGQIEMFESNGKEYPFYANLSIAKHLESSLEATQGTQAREMPTIVTDFKNANPEAFDQAVREGLALISGLRNAVTSNPSVPIVFDLGYITQGNRIGTKIAPLSEVESPVQITFKTKQTAENNGLTYPGVVGQAVGLIDGSPYLLFNRFIEEVGGRAEVEALAELIFNPETRAKFFDETKELIEYIANHYNIFQAGGRKLEFSTKKGVLEVFAVTIKNGKKEFTPITTPEQFISFMTKTDTPGVRYNVKKEGVGTNTRMFRLENGEVVEEEMSYNEFVRRTHKILASTDPILRNKQVVFDGKSLREVVKPTVSTPPAAPVPPAEKKEEENWSFPERERPAEEAKPSVRDYSPIAERILSYKDAEFLNAIKNDLEASNFLINVVGISADQNPVNLVKARVQSYLDKQKAGKEAPVSDEAKKAESEKELFSETDSKGRTNTVFSNTKEKDGLIKTTFTFNRSDKDPSQRNKMVTGIPVEKALGNKYTINEEYIPEGAKVVGVSEIRISKTGAAATVTFEVDGERFQGEVVLNSNTTYDAELEALEAKPEASKISNKEVESKILQVEAPTIQTVDNVTFGTAAKTNERNEDAVYVDNQKGIFALADGMGGLVSLVMPSGDFAREVIKMLVTGQVDTDNPFYKAVEILKEARAAAIKNQEEGKPSFEDKYWESVEQKAMSFFPKEAREDEYFNYVFQSLATAIYNSEDYKGTFGRSGAVALKATRTGTNTYEIEKAGDTVFFVVDKNNKVIQKHGLSTSNQTDGYVLSIKKGEIDIRLPKIDKFTVTLNEGEKLVLSSDFIETDKAVQDFINSNFGKNINFDEFRKNNKDDDATFITIEYKKETPTELPKTTKAPKVETKVAPGKPAFPEKVPYDNVRAVIGSITKSIWEQLPQERKGSVKRGPDGELEYYVALESKSNNLKVEGRIEIQFIDSKDPNFTKSMSEELEKYFVPKTEKDKKGKLTVVEGIETVSVNLNNMNWAQSSFQIFFDADAVSKISGKPSSTGRWAAFPKDITDKIDFQENLANIISQLSQETVIPNPSVEINPFKNLMAEAAAPPQGAPPIVENAFGEEELNKGQEQKKNCETTGKPGTFKKPPGFTKTKPGDKNKL